MMVFPGFDPIRVSERLTALEGKFDELDRKLDHRLGDIATSVRALAEEKRVQNGRVGKLEDWQERHEHASDVARAYARGRRALLTFAVAGLTSGGWLKAVIAALVAAAATALGFEASAR